MAMKITVEQMVREAEKEIQTLSVPDAIKLADSDDHVFVDLRDVRELDHEGMVPEAVHAPRGMIEFLVCPDSPYHKDIFSSSKTFVFYCRSGWRTALATKAVKSVGLENVCHIDSDFSAWKEADGPVVEWQKKKKE
jgi:rhodanese-related sulfurtransferase